MAYKKYKGSNSFYDVMVRIYARLVANGMKDISDVPETYRADVAEYLKQNA